MPNTFLTRYRLVVNDLKHLAVELNSFLSKDTGQDTQDDISEVEAVLAQYYLKQILESLSDQNREAYMAIPLPTDAVIDYLCCVCQNHSATCLFTYL
jgi:hypothetical protein